MRKNYIHLVILIFFTTSWLSACGNPKETVKDLGVSFTAKTDLPQSSGHERQVVDLLQRQVNVPEKISRVVAIGPGALRLYVYVGNLDYLVGIEQIDANDATGKPYVLANPDLRNLPLIGQGGPNNPPDPEKLLAISPDVIFSTYATDVSAADDLQTKTNIPVVVLSYGGFGVTKIFNDEILQSLELIGELISETENVQKITNYLKQTEEDLDRRTRDIPEDKKPSVYIGGLGSRGTHGIGSTQAKYALLDAIHARNVADETGANGAVMIDKEKLLEWDPDYIFIDQGGYSLVVEDYQKNPTFYQALSALQNEQIFFQLRYNNYSTNLDTAIANAYYLGKILYPEAFADIDPIAKADEIYLAMLNKPLYAQMTEDAGGFGKIKFD